jgi:hypothetical protein
MGSRSEDAAAAIRHPGPVHGVRLPGGGRHRALWLAWRPSVGRWMLAAVTLVVLAPAVGNASWHTTLSDRPFFSHADTSRVCARPTES